MNPRTEALHAIGKDLDDIGRHLSASLVAEAAQYIEGLELALSQQERFKWAANERADKTYTVLESLRPHECHYGCDSQYGVNCNCQGKCEVHKKPDNKDSNE